MADWVGIVNTTIHKFIQDYENNVMRNRKWLAKLQADGQVTYNWSGDQMEWRLQYRQHSMTGIAEGDSLTFSRPDLFVKANLEYRGYALTDFVSKKEKLMNTGREAIINRYSEITKLMMESVEASLSEELYVDGNAAGNEKKLHGIASFMGDTGSAISGTPVMNPKDSYAGLATDLGDKGGTWSGNWPKGTGSLEYDYFSPLILDATSTLATASGGWSSSTATWAARCLEILRFALVHTMKNKAGTGNVNFAILNSEYYRLFLDALAAKERIIVQTNNKNTLRGLGFDDTTFFDGAEITFEYGVPNNQAFGFNSKQMEMRSMQKKLFDSYGPEYDSGDNGYRFLVDFYGNLVFNPRYFFKIYQAGSSGA